MRLHEICPVITKDCDKLNDLCEVLHDLEWWQSSDISEADYRETVAKFKKKWLNGDRKVRLKTYIDKQIKMVRDELYEMIGGIE